jgi:hypothetical protein
VTCVLLGGNTHIELNMVFAMPDEARALPVSESDSTEYGESCPGGSEYERLVEVWQLLVCYDL